jgi:hypothetical protein
MSSASDDGRWHDAAVIRMMHQARSGDPAAVHDLVEFARIQPNYRFPEVTQTLAEVLTASGTSGAERTAVESLQGTFVYSAIEREAAIIRLTSRARLGDTRAVYDLIEMAKSYSYAHHPMVIETLVDISVSKTAPREHRAAVESLRGHPIFEEVAKGQRERALANIIRAAKSGDHAALQDLVRLAESRTFMDDWRIVAALADIFLTDGPSKDDKSLIWSLQDQQIYSVYVEDSDHSYRFVQEGDEGGWVDDGPTGHTEHYTLWRYLQERRSEQLERWLANQRR